MTDNQFKAFGFYGENLMWNEIIKILSETQEATCLQAISSSSKGEDRVHACGQADGINLILSLLINLRIEAKRLNGLTDE